MTGVQTCALPICGGTQYGYSAGVGGNGGGGNGSVTSAGDSGTANTGGGGGGNGKGSSPGGNGGSGVVIIKYPNTYKAASTTGSPTYTNTGGYRIYKYTSSGTITF